MHAERFRADPQKSLVGFMLGDVHYALDISRVIQIINPQTTTALPMMPESVMGVFEFRGTIIPVVDMRQRFALPNTNTTRRTKWVLVDVGGLPAAIIVDAVTEVFGITENDLRPAPPVGGGDRRGIIAITNHAGRLTFVLDILKIRSSIDALALPSSDSVPAIAPSSTPPRHMGSKT